MVQKWSARRASMRAWAWIPSNHRKAYCSFSTARHTPELARQHYPSRQLRVQTETLSLEERWGRASETAWGWKRVLSEPRGLSLTWNPSEGGGGEAEDSEVLPTDLHMCTVEHVYPHQICQSQRNKESHTCKSFSCIQRRGNDFEQFLNSNRKIIIILKHNILKNNQ